MLRAPVILCERLHAALTSQTCQNRQVKSKSSHLRPLPSLASGAHSIGFRMVVCCLCIDLTGRRYRKVPSHGGRWETLGYKRVAVLLIYAHAT